MKLLSLTGRRVQPWPHLDDDAPLIPQTHGVVTLARLQDERDAVAKALHSVGVQVPGHSDAGDVGPLLDRLALVEIAFPSFKDGRGFTLATRLRKDWGYTGELRASGPVLPDQAAFLLRCGFDSLEIADERAPVAEAALSHFSHVMQMTALDAMSGRGRPSVLHHRHILRAKAA